MSLLQSFIDRLLGRFNIPASIATGISDDGSADPVAVGKPSPLRVDPTTGALLVSSSGGGGGGGTVDQGTGAAVGSSWSVRIANAGASGFVTPFVAGENVLSDLRVGSVAVSNSNPVPISDAGSSVTVDGTVAISGSVAVTGPLTDVQLRASAVPVSASSLPLPTGAATAAKQPALGIAGTASTDVITVQGISGGTALPVSLSGTVTVDSEMSAAVAAGPGMANPTAGGVIAYGALYRSSTGLWTRMEGDGSGLHIQGNTLVGTALNHNPIVIGGCNSSTVTRIQTDSTGRLTIVGAGANGSAVTGNPSLVAGSDGTNARTIATTTTGSPIVSFDNVNTGPFGDLIVEGKKPVLSRHWTILNAFDPQQDETVTQANGATVTVSSQRLALTSGTTNAADACYRTIKTAQYRPGQGFVFRWTAAFTTGVANSTQEIGFGNGANGGGGNSIAVGYNGTSFGILHRNAGSSTWIAQSSWNGDRLNGSGVSGVTLTPTNLNVYFAHVPFLGAGAIHLYAMLPSGSVTRIHTIQYPNSTTALEFSDPAFRFYGRVVSTGSTTNLVAYSGSAAAFTVGAIGDLGQQWAESRTVSVNGTAAIMSIRCATTVNGALNNTPLRIRSISLTADNGNTTTIGIGSFGVTLGGTPAFAALTGKSASTANNGVTLTSATTIGTVDIAGTTVTGGDPIWNTATPRNSTAMSGEMEENPIYIFPGQTLTLYATTGTATNVTYAINGTVG